VRSTNVSEICSHGTRQLRYWDRARDDHVMAEYGLRPSDQLAPIVRNSADGERELVVARWGMPGPLQFGGQPVPNIRNVASPHWRGWLSARNRCLVPATSFCGDRGAYASYGRPDKTLTDVKSRWAMPTSGKA
jgi:putative SOS response-associated peptidase YedK